MKKFGSALLVLIFAMPGMSFASVKSFAKHPALVSRAAKVSAKGAKKAAKAAKPAAKAAEYPAKVLF